MSLNYEKKTDIMSFYSKTVVSSKLTQGGSLPKSAVLPNISILTTCKTQVWMKQLILGKMTDFGSRIRGKIWMCRLDFDVRALESKPSPSRCPSPEIWPKRNAVSYRTFHFLTIIQLDNLLTKKTFNQKFFVLMELNMFYSPQSFPIKNVDPKISFKNSGTKMNFRRFLNQLL